MISAAKHRTSLLVCSLYSNPIQQKPAPTRTRKCDGVWSHDRFTQEMQPVEKKGGSKKSGQSAPKEKPESKPAETPVQLPDNQASRNEAILAEDEKESESLSVRQSYEPASRRESQASRRGSTAPIETIKCYICGQLGHMARDCTNINMTASTPEIDDLSAMPVQLPAEDVIRQPVLTEASIQTQRRKLKSERKLNQPWDHAMFSDSKQGRQSRGYPSAGRERRAESTVEASRAEAEKLTQPRYDVPKRRPVTTGRRESQERSVPFAGRQNPVERRPYPSSRTPLPGNGAHAPLPQTNSSRAPLPQANSSRAPLPTTNPSRAPLSNSRSIPNNTRNTPNNTRNIPNSFPRNNPHKEPAQPVFVQKEVNSLEEPEMPSFVTHQPKLVPLRTPTDRVRRFPRPIQSEPMQDPTPVREQRPETFPQNQMVEPAHVHSSFSNPNAPGFNPQQPMMLPITPQMMQSQMFPQNMMISYGDYGQPMMQYAQMPMQEMPMGYQPIVGAWKR